MITYGDGVDRDERVDSDECKDNTDQNGRPRMVYIFCLCLNLEKTRIKMIHWNGESTK